MIVISSPACKSNPSGVEFEQQGYSFFAHLSLLASLSDSSRQRMSLTLTGPLTFLTSCLASLFKKTTLTWVIPPLDPIKEDKQVRKKHSIISDSKPKSFFDNFILDKCIPKQNLGMKFIN